MNIDYNIDFDDSQIAYLKTLSRADLESHLHNSQMTEIAANTAQINRKLLINSCYGALTKYSGAL